MRVLFVSSAIGGRSAGTGRFAPVQQTDLDLLRSLGHEVRAITWRPRAITHVLRGARWADIVYCWSISDHAYLASIVANRLACVVGGFEFANLPEYDYGNLSRWRMRLVTKRVWRTADALLYVDRSLAEEARRAFGHSGKEFIVPTGYDTAFWTPGAGPREDIVLTVCNAWTMERWRLKGVDVFIEVAKRCPDLSFHIIGEIPETAQTRSLPPNVVLHGFLEPPAIRELYRHAKVYCQLSVHEGLPNAVCEAMLCGCVPVGTAVNGIPTAIGDAGFIVDREPKAIAEAIRRAAKNEELGAEARDRIRRMFPLDRRRNGLREILDSLIAMPA